MGISALIIGGAAALGAGASMGISALTKPKTGTAPKAPALPATPSGAKTASQASRSVRHKMAAQTNTVFSSPLGIGGQAQVARKTLTGQ